MKKSQSTFRKLAIIGILGICVGACAINNEITKTIGKNKRTLVPFPVLFTTLGETDAAEILANGKSLEDDLTDIFASGVVDFTAAKMQICEQKKCDEIFNFSKSQELAKMPIARPDLNNDGKKDLVINIIQNTGIGNCASAEYRFYENIGNDFRPIGKARVTRIQTLYEIDDARRGEFKTLMWRAKFDCENNPIDSQDRQTYDKGNKQYYSIE